MINLIDCSQGNRFPTSTELSDIVKSKMSEFHSHPLIFAQEFYDAIEKIIKDYRSKIIIDFKSDYVF